MTYEPKTKPFSHQARLFEETKHLRSHAVLWEQGTGKTKPTIDIFANAYEEGEIDGVVVVAPNGVHLNWINDELPTHLPDRIAKKTSAIHFRSNKASTKWHQAELDKHLGHDGLAILCISYNGFMTKAGKNAVWKFLKRRRCFYILDEAHNVKTPNAKRTKSIIASAKYADWRRILTGTPGDKPFDLYSQLRFIDPDIWSSRDMGNFYAFKNYFGEWFTRQQAKELYNYDPGFDKLVRFRNLEECAEILASVSDRVLKEDVLDLPPKLYTKLYFEMTPKQSQMYETLRETLELELQSGVIDGSMAIVRLLRLQQIACGYAVADIEEPVELCDKKNPRLDKTLEFLEPINHQVILWARFKHDIEQLMDALGDKAVRYDGQISDEDCERNKQAFNAGDAQYFIANSGKGSEGLTLVGAKTTIFYSNSYKFLQRLQAEDRNHRIGQDGAVHGDKGLGVLYADLCAQGTVDENVIENLRKKYDIASQLTGDKLKEWI
jgi:SNF2 family DNA or RNA helicase